MVAKKTGKPIQKGKKVKGPTLTRVVRLHGGALSRPAAFTRPTHPGKA